MHLLKTLNQAIVSSRCTLAQKIQLMQLSDSNEGTSITDSIFDFRTVAKYVEYIKPQTKICLKVLDGMLV